MKISVIVPIYNVEQYLETCLTSIVGQTMKDIEIVLINDGSTDGSLQIAENFAIKDQRIRLISQANAGQAAARNAGLKMAQGEYIVFVDSDDWIESDMLEVLYERITHDCSDFVQCRFQFDNSATKVQTVYGREYDYSILCGKDILCDALLIKNVLVAPCIKMYKRQFLIENDLFFESGIVNEDTLHQIQLACCVQKVSFVNKVLYHAIEREGSTSRSSYERLCSHMLIALEKARDYMMKKERFHDVESLYKARYLKSILYNFLQMAQRLPFKEFYKLWKWNMQHSLYKEYNTCLIRKILPFKHRLMLMIAYCPFVCYGIVRVGNRFSFRMH